MDNLKKIMDNPIARKAVIGMGIFILAIIIIIIAVSCSGGRKYTYEELEQKLITVAQNHYENKKEDLPKNNGDQITISAQTFVNEKRIGELSKIVKDNESCRAEVKVINNNGYYLYIPEVNCGEAYKSTTLYDKLTDAKNLVTSGNGLYAINNEYVFKGESVNNYLLIKEKEYRILRVNADGSIKVLKKNKVDSTSWDDRYNISEENTDGINDYITNGINSRVKDALDTAYNNPEFVTEDEKAYFAPKALCIGKRSATDTINDGSIECSETLDNQVFGLIQANEYLNASLDPNCTTFDSVSCGNYNYFSTIGTTWTITADKDTSYKAFKLLSDGLTISKTSSTSSLRVVTNLNKEVLYASGTGTETDPYVIK